MKEKFYKDASIKVQTNELFEQYMADLRNAITDARNQAENNSSLGMAVAIGNAYNITDHLISLYNAMK